MGRWRTTHSQTSRWMNGEEREREGVGRALRTGHVSRGAVAPPAAVSNPDPVDAARAREDEAVHLAALQRRHELDATMDEVLHSLATGQYGRCIECGQHIALARLRAMPLAVRCLACQDRFERIRRAATARASRHETPNMQEVGR